MSKFIGEISTDSSDTNSSSEDSSISDFDIKDVKTQQLVTNEEETKAEIGHNKKESEGNSKEENRAGQKNRKSKKANLSQNQEIQRTKLTPQKTVQFVRKIIRRHKKHVLKDKHKLNKLLKCASAAARDYKTILNKVSKKIGFK